MSSQRSLMPKKRKSYWSVSEIGPSPLKVDADDADGRVGIWKAPLPGGTAELKSKSCVLIWNGEKCDRKWFSVIQNGRRQPFCEKIKVVYWSEMERNAIESDFRSSKMAAGSHFVEKMKWREMWSKFIFGLPKWGGGGASQWPACKTFGDIHSICHWANTPILV